IETDSKTGKQTLAVRLGESKTQVLYALMLLGAVGTYVVIAFLYTLLSLIAVAVLPLCLRLIYNIYAKESSQDLIKILENTAKLHLLAGLLLSTGLAIGL
ncbi:MAG: 1,4-dihydroxy-2-naphthoate polyprenyltransferase, partial [Actinomycetota bacterium]|nr:1,4-dihydroxy-2-naphthoate polyprenyltransferase [Actinomycetota bacterium]